MDSICAILVGSSILQFRLRNTTFTFSQNVPPPLLSFFPISVANSCKICLTLVLEEATQILKTWTISSQIMYLLGQFKLATLYLTNSQLILLGGKSECWHSQFSIMISKLQYLLKNMSDLSWNIYISFGITGVGVKLHEYMR